MQYDGPFFRICRPPHSTLHPGAVADRKGSAVISLFVISCLKKTVLWVHIGAGYKIVILKTEAYAWGQNLIRLDVTKKSKISFRHDRDRKKNEATLQLPYD